MATGFYEGSLPVEGTLGRTKRSLSRGGVDAVLAAPSLLQPTRATERELARRAREGRQAERQEGEATGVSEARSHRAPWEDNAHARADEKAARPSATRLSFFEEKR
jgi:hypothetical protein